MVLILLPESSKVWTTVWLFLNFTRYWINEMHSNYWFSTSILTLVINKKIVKTKTTFWVWVFKETWMRSSPFGRSCNMLPDSYSLEACFNLHKSCWGGVNQVYTSGRGTSCFSTQLLFVTVSSSFSKIPIRVQDICSCRGSGLTVNRFGFFFFVRFGGLVFLNSPLTIPIVSIHFSDTNKGLECRLRYAFDSFIKHIVSGV